VFADCRQSSGVALRLEVSEDQSLFVVKLAEYLVVTQVVTVTDTKPGDSTSLKHFDKSYKTERL